MQAKSIFGRNASLVITGGKIMAQEIISFVTDEVYGVWFLIGAALVFWMQAGFAMCEA